MTAWCNCKPFVNIFQCLQWCLLQFKAISQAYEVLSDQSKRDLYDRGGEEAIKEGHAGGGGFHSPMDIFDMFFGGGMGGRAHHGPKKGKDAYHQIAVSLEDLYNGTTRKLALQKNVICPKCEGNSCCPLFIIHKNLSLCLPQ